MQHSSDPGSHPFNSEENSPHKKGMWNCSVRRIMHISHAHDTSLLKIVNGIAGAIIIALTIFVKWINNTVCGINTLSDYETRWI